MIIIELNYRRRLWKYLINMINIYFNHNNIYICIYLYSLYYIYIYNHEYIPCIIAYLILGNAISVGIVNTLLSIPYIIYVILSFGFVLGCLASNISWCVYLLIPYIYKYIIYHFRIEICKFILFIMIILI